MALINRTELYIVMRSIIIIFYKLANTQHINHCKTVYLGPLLSQLHFCLNHLCFASRLKKHVSVSKKKSNGIITHTAFWAIKLRVTLKFLDFDIYENHFLLQLSFKICIYQRYTLFSEKYLFSVIEKDLPILLTDYTLLIKCYRS